MRRRAAGPAGTDAYFYNDGTLIAGTLTEAAGPVAAALLIAGSGRINRDSDARLGRRGPFVLRTGVTGQLARALAAAGVTTLRFDKRGVGASGGDYLRSGLSDNLSDARAALRWLAARHPGLPLLIVGHSEGTWHAAALAAADDQVAGAALLCAPGGTGREVLAYQVAAIEPTLPRLARLVMRLTRQDFAQVQRKRLAMLQASDRDVIRVGGARASAKWWRELLSHDPAADFAKIGVPVLAVTGGNDVQVPPQDVAAIGRLVTGPFEGHVVGDLNHLLRPDPGRKGLGGYRASLREPLNPEVTALVTAWVAGHWGRQP